MRLFDCFRPTRAALVAAACCLLAAGCSGSPTPNAGKSTEPEDKSVVEKIKDGMTGKQVFDIMGPPAFYWFVDTEKQADVLKLYHLPAVPTTDLPGVPAPKMVIKRWFMEGDTRVDAVLRDGRFVPAREEREAKGDTRVDVVFRDGQVVGKTSGRPSEMPMEGSGGSILVAGMTPAGPTEAWPEENDKIAKPNFPDPKEWVIEDPVPPPPSPKVTKANTDKIKVGMAKAEVVAILGPGTVIARSRNPKSNGEVLLWIGEGICKIGFADNKVTIVAWEVVPRASDTPN